MQGNRTKSTRVEEPELRAMSKIHKIIANMPDEESRMRILVWIIDKIEGGTIFSSGAWRTMRTKAFQQLGGE